MAKHKWLKLTGLVLASHLILSNCQNKQETQTAPTTQTTQTTTSSSKNKTTPDKDKDKDKNKDTTTTTTTPESTEKAIPGVTVPTSDGFILTENSVILSRTKDGIVVDHNGHSHFIFYSDLLGTKFAYLIPAGVTVTTTQTVSEQSPAQPASSGDHHYVFDPADIVAEDANGYTVRHGDHYHYILKSSLTGPYNQTSSSGIGGVISPVQPSQTNHQLPSAPSAGLAGIDYPTSDGFLFDGTGMSGWTDLGLLVNHNGHLHLLLTGDLARSKWAYLLASRPGQPPAPTVSNPTPSAPDKPSQPAQAVVPVKDEVAEKRAYLARETGNAEDKILLIETANGQAFMYPHGDHHHVVLLSQLDVTKPFDDGHGDEHHDNHDHKGDDHDKGNQSPATDPDGHQDSPDPTPIVPEQPTAPTQPVQDEVAIKRAYLARETGNAETAIKLIDTPNGQAFMYPHGDHYHVVLLSEIDVTKPFDDGHGDHGQTDSPHDDHNQDDQGDSGDGHSGDQDGSQDTQTDEAGHDHGSDQADTTGEGHDHTDPAQDSGNQAGDDTTSQTEPEQPTTPTQPVQDEVAVKRAYLARETGNAETAINLIDTPNGQAFMYPHGDHYHVVLLSEIDVTKPFDDGHGDHGQTDTPHDDHGQQGDDHSQDDQGDSGDGHSGDQDGNQDTQTDEAGHDHGSDQTGTTGEGHDHTDPAQDSGNQAGDDTTSQTEPEQPTAPTQPVQDDVAVKRAYLAAATGLDGASIQLIDTPNGQAFMYPHGDHHHVILLSQIDVTKPFDDGHGHQDNHGDQGDAHNHDEQDHSDDAQSGDQEGDHDQDSNQADTTGDRHDHTDPAQDAGNQAGDDTTSPTEPEQPTAPTQPVQDDVAVKRAYLAVATGLDGASIQLIDTPNGQAFMYPHGDHHHVILLSQIDVTKPFDDGHGHQDNHGDKGDGHNHDEQDHSDDAQSGDQEGDHDQDSNQADTTGDSHNHTDPAQDAGNQAGDDATSPTEPGQSTPPGQSTEPTTPAKPGVAGIDYPTSDGFLFDGTGMAGWTSAGLLVNHNGHTHILPTEAIANSKWAHLIPKTDEVTPPAPVELSDKLAKQRDDLAKQLGLAPEDIRVVTADGKVVGFEYPHEDHYDFVPANTSDGSSSGLTEQDKRDLTAYIRKTYGLLMGTPVTFHDDFVVFAIPHPHQDYDVNRDYYSDVLDPAYDPGHVHPYAVPLSTLSIPVSTGIPELDFENELLWAAKRIGVAPSDVQIKNKKYFVLPGKDHDHYLNILTPVAGLDAYMANKLPDIKAHFALGDYSKEAVVAEADRILAAAKDKFGAGTVEFRRVARALEAFKAHLTVPTTSTDGYVKALQSFENKYLKGLTEAVEEPAVVDEVVATYLRLTEKLQGYDERTLKNFGLNAGQKVAELKRLVAAKDEAGLARVATHFAAIDRVKAAANDLGPRLAYMDFFLRHLDSDKLPASLRQEVLDKLIELQKISGLYRNPQKFREGLESTALLKEKVKQALAADGPAPDHANWTPYPMGFDRREIVREVNSMRDFVIKHKEVTAEELAEGFNKPLDLFKPHPKKPAQPVTPPVQPQPVEEGNQPVQPTDPETPPTGDTQPGTDTNQPQPDQEGSAPGQDETTPTESEQPKPVALDVQHEVITTWLTGLTAANLRHYSINREGWNSELDAALANQDQVAIAKFQAYKSAIERVEKDKNINATRTTHVDYFLRQIDQPYLDEALRERVAQQLLTIYAANTYNFKQALVDTVALKVAIKSAQEANQTHPMGTGASYQTYLEQKDAMIASVEQRKEWLIGQNLITAEEIAEGFGQPYPPAP